MDASSCSICGNAVASFDNYLRHLRQKHGDTGSSVATALIKEKKGALEFECPSCDYKGPSKSALSKHKARNHREPLAPLSSTNMDGGKKSWVVCPQCSITTYDLKSLISHAREKHGFHGEVMRKRFENEEDFMVDIFLNIQVWKEEQEKSSITSSCYSCRTNGDLKTKYHKRYRNKVLLQAVENKVTGIIDVEYCDKHIGHLVSAALLPLSNRDKKEICLLLKKPFSVPSVTRAIRMEHAVPSERLYWITATDVRNTLSSMGLEKGKYNDNDLESFATRFFKNDPEDGMRSFSPPTSPDGTGFCLIIITPLQESLLKKYGIAGISLDDTHNTCRYNLKLLTLMVVDNKGRDREAASDTSSRANDDNSVRDASLLSSSSDSDVNNNAMDPTTSHFQMFDYLSVYIGKLVIKGSSEAQLELEKVEREVKSVLGKLTYDKEMPASEIPLRRELDLDGRPPHSMKQIRKGGFRCQIDMMLKRTELRVGKKKHGISALIPKDIDGEELDLCAVCDKREPPEKLRRNDAPIDWVQCDSCLTWVHLECIRAKECVLWQ
ncbi:hypothetical protein GCK32_008979, partial [Trichostrongylus colubriformis]